MPTGGWIAIAIVSAFVLLCIVLAWANLRTARRLDEQLVGTNPPEWEPTSLEIQALREVAARQAAEINDQDTQGRRTA